MTYDVRLDIHATTDEEIELEVREGCYATLPDGAREPLYRVTGTNTVDGPFAVWLDHSCDEWLIAEGRDAYDVALRVLMFARALEEKAIALLEVHARSTGKD